VYCSLNAQFYLTATLVRSIVRYHTAWTEVDETYPNFGQDGSSTQHTATTNATDTGSSLRTEETADDSSDSDSTVSGSDSSETESGPESHDDGPIDMHFGDFEDDLDFLSVGHAQSRSMSYPSIHFGNEDDPSRPTSNDATPELSRNVSPAPLLKVPTPASTPKQTRTLYIQVTLRYLPFIDPFDSTNTSRPPDGVRRKAHPPRSDRRRRLGNRFLAMDCTLLANLFPCPPSY
jgi:hypothetical protein